MAELYLRQNSEPFSGSLQCTVGSNENIKNEIISRIRQQTKCELLFHSHIKDSFPRQISTNYQHVLVP